MQWRPRLSSLLRAPRVLVLMFAANWRSASSILLLAAFMGAATAGGMLISPRVGLFVLAGVSLVVSVLLGWEAR